jgi:type VI secretion system protein VasI
MAGNGGWMRKDGASKLTHEPEVQVLTMSKPYAGRYGKVQATMVVRCNEKTTAVTINWGEYLGDDSSDLGNWKRMRYRIDDKPAVNIRLSLSTNNEAVGWWSGAEAIPIIRQIVKADRFVAEITPYGENVRLAEFSVVGLAPHAADIAKACGWSIEPKPMPVN